MQGDSIFGILVLLAMCFPIVLLTRRLGGSSLIAYLIVGGLASNFGLVHIHDIHSLAEIGATLLLFSLGLELDLPAMRKHLGRLLLGGLGQIGLTLIIGTAAMLACGIPLNQAVIIGACLTLSSTLMVLRALDEHHLRNKESGRTIIGILLVQDFAIAPLLILISFLLPSGDINTLHVTIGVVSLIIMTVFLRSFLASHIIRRIRGAQVPELEIALAMTVAIGAAVLTESLGIGAAMGAFCAGLALGGDEHTHAIETSTRPLQGLVAIIFFASIGMQFNAEYAAEHYVLIFIALCVSVLVKSGIAILALRTTGMKLRTAIGSGIIIGQVGEFSFILASAARDTLGEYYDLIIAVSCLSLALTPLLVILAKPFLPKSRLDEITDKGETIVVGGLGPVGNTIVTTLHDSGHPLLLVDRNAKLLEAWKNTDNVTCHLGRIEEMEEWIPIIGKKPRVVVLTFPIVDASALVADKLLHMDPHLMIIARSPYESQINTLYNAGIRYVICDERESARALEPLLAEILGTFDEQGQRLKTSQFRKLSTGEFADFKEKK